MPELPPFQPQVSVFHLSSKVSSAKIAKYRQATERGMILKAGFKTVDDTALGDEEIDEPPSPKRPRLKLSVREPPSMDKDTIAVSRPKRSTAGKLSHTNRKKREWSTAFSENEVASTSRSQTSIVDSSDLSSCDSEVVIKQDSLPARGVTPRPVDGYGDFMSYYVQDDEDDKKSKEVVKDVKQAQPAKKKAKTAAKPTKRQSSVSSAPQPSKIQTPIPAAPLQQPQPPQQAPPPQRPPQQPHPPPLAPVTIDIREREPDTIAVMIMKLDTLSTALSDFGGAPAIPQTPDIPEEDDGTVDNFLALFSGDAPQHRSKKPKVPQRFEDLKQPGTQDISLAYGIQFIMNALKSWAEQRLHAQRLQMLQSAANVRRANGKPIEIQAHNLPFMTPMNLFETPEGRAIQAFRAVVESGCLRVNAVLPSKLAKPLRRLYMQIDHLINQTGKGQPPWRCLSYNAQIEANRVRVEKHKEAQVKAQEDMIRQQQINHQQAMRSMGLPDHLTSTMFYHHSQDGEQSESGARHNNSDLVRLPIDPAQRYNSTSHGPGVPHPSNGMPGHPQHPRKPGDTAFLPRSGQSMKFSFAPSSDHAIKAFGAQSFPTTPIKRESASATPLDEAPQNIKPSVEAARISPAVVSGGFSAVNKPANR